MKISTQSRYGLRALFDISYNSAGSSTQVKEISARQSISPRYIEQIFQKLKRADIIKSVRGPSGGYYLARKARDITVGDVVRATEGAVELVRCSGTTGKKAKCERIDACAVRNMWVKASRTLMEYLDSVTLQDLCDEAQNNGVPQPATLDGSTLI
jgi:Rrf2 family transcriptional regulator, iron-sulfur cluster assembly transcription factor